LREAGEIATAVQDMVVRGAPAIGITAAYAVVLSVRQHASEPDWRERVRGDIELLEKTRPTAINLRWALVRMAGVLEQVESPDVEAFLAEAVRIHEKDFADNLHMAEAGASLIPEGVNVLTHCNTGALATGGHGTALGVIRTAWGQGKIKHVYVDETRPWLQGSRLTAWELQRDGIPFSVLCEGAAGSLYYSWDVPSPLGGARFSRIYGREGSVAFESNGGFVAVHGERTRFWPVPGGLADAAGYRPMFRDFVEALTTGRPPEYDLRLARRDLELVEQIYDSMDVSLDSTEGRDG
jgi:methylthioribose-1-phosphate isomerase